VIDPPSRPGMIVGQTSGMTFVYVASDGVCVVVSSERRSGGGGDDYGLDVFKNGGAALCVS
jgi:hypothetical protein